MTDRSMISQFLRFLGIGGFTTALQYVILIFLAELHVMAPVWASATGYAVSAFFNYLMNYYFTFTSREKHYSAAARFSLVATIGLLLNTALMYLATEIFLIHYLISQIFATGVVLIWNFTANRSWTYKAS